MLFVLGYCASCVGRRGFNDGSRFHFGEGRFGHRGDIRLVVPTSGAAHGGCVVILSILLNLDVVARVHFLLSFICPYLNHAFRTH